MTTKEPRSLKGVAIAIVVATFIIGVSLFAPSFLEPRTSTTTTTVNATTPPTTISAVATGSINPSNNLQLQLSINVSSSAMNISLDATVYEFNTLVSADNLTATSNWAVALNGDDGPPCLDNTSYPVQIAVAQGYYTYSNVSAAKFLDLVNTHASNVCPDYVAYQVVAGYVFQPTSNIATNYGCKVPISPCFPSLTNPISAGIGVMGYWNQGGTFTSFQPGTYTVLGEDEWGGTILAYFTVS